MDIYDKFINNEFLMGDLKLFDKSDNEAVLNKFKNDITMKCSMNST